MEMTPNVGGKDAKIRMGAGVVLALLGLVGMLGTWAVIVGIIAAASGYMKFCPAYRLLGMNTCETS